MQRNIDPTIERSIQDKLAWIEAKYSVRILYAVESGSRAWGFESVDSDYDVRFIYCHTAQWYVKVFPERDVIELPLQGLDDYSGWDIKKALYLLSKSNPVLYEWLRSPIIYKECHSEMEAFRKVADLYFSPIAAANHYLHMARGNYREFLQGDTVKVKKYFYVLRPILASLWIIDRNQAPPMEFEQLLDGHGGAIRDAVLELLTQKKQGKELGERPRIAAVNKFLEENIEFITARIGSLETSPKLGKAQLDELLWSTVSRNGVMP
ncbi:MAG: nucleotidyltransferase domain-containing protein [Rectinemataceae bacterium]